MIADEDMDAATRADMQQWTGCVAGALTRGQFEAALADAGLVDLEIRETHRVHEHASLGDRARAQACARCLSREGAASRSSAATDDGRTETRADVRAAARLGVAPEGRQRERATNGSHSTPFSAEAAALIVAEADAAPDEDGGGDLSAHAC